MILPHDPLKSKAIKLRRQGLSYNEIKEKTGLSKSTLSGWLKNIPLSEADKKRLYTKQIQILSRGPNSQKERRKREVDSILERGAEETSKISSEEAYKLFGVALYWAEGSKGGGVSFTNSDPLMVLFIVKWIEKILGVKPLQLKAWLNIYPQQNDLEIKMFWSNLTGIPIDRFGKSFIKPANRDFKKNNLYFGTVKIHVPKSTNLKHLVHGWLQGYLSDLRSDFLLIERRWEFLKNTPRPVNLVDRDLNVP